MFKSLLKPDSATVVGLLTATGVYLIYNNALPNLTDVRTAPAHDTDVETARRHAAIKSAALIGAVFLVAKDVNSYIISGVALFGVDAMFKHANAVNHQTGKIDASADGQSIAPGLATAYPLDSYTETAA